MLLKAEFLAIALVLVYVGAVMVLFLFVVMMLDINRHVRKGFWKHFPWRPLSGALIALEMAAVLMGASVAFGRAQGAGGAWMPQGRSSSTPTPRRWASCSTRNTCIPWKSPP
jgi:NADH-quinone oxidoreductase subunit J